MWKGKESRDREDDRTYRGNTSKLTWLGVGRGGGQEDSGPECATIEPYEDVNMAQRGQLFFVFKNIAVEEHIVELLHCSPMTGIQTMSNWHGESSSWISPYMIHTSLSVASFAGSSTR
jgi:hypothetical protein